MVFQLDNQIYYSTTRTVEAGERLRVWYAKGYAKKFNKPFRPCNNDPTQHSAEDIAEIVSQNVATFEETPLEKKDMEQGVSSGSQSLSNSQDLVGQDMDVCIDIDVCRDGQDETANESMEQAIVASGAFDISRNG